MKARGVLTFAAGLTLAVAACAFNEPADELVSCSSVTAPSYSSESIPLTVATRNEAGTISTHVETVDPRQVGIVVFDVWDRHWDPVASSRVDALVPLLNTALNDARERGMTVFIAAADIPVERVLRRGGCLPADSGASAMPDFPGDGMWWPQLPHIPYFNAAREQTQIPPDVDQNRLPQWTTVHPALDIAPTDVVIDFEEWSADGDEQAWNMDSTRSMFQYAQSRGITHLIYTGVHANWSILTKNTGMLNMDRLGFEVLIAGDLTDSFTGNGVAWESSPPANDSSVTPDAGHRQVLAFLERWFGSVSSTDWARSDASRYAALVRSEPGVLAHWRLDSIEDGTDAYLDELRLESAWGEPVGHVSCPAEFGSVMGSSICLEGTPGVVIGPALREDLPPDSPLRAFASSDATLEVWVRPVAAEASGWIIAHDGSEVGGLDFALGVNAGQLQFDALGDAVTVTGQGILSPERWHHVGVTIDHREGIVRLYLDGHEDGTVPISSSFERYDVESPWVLGGRGPVAVANGDPGEDRSGLILSAGTDGFVGGVDELALYSGVLSEERLRDHARWGAQ